MNDVFNCQYEVFKTNTDLNTDIGAIAGNRGTEEAHLWQKVIHTHSANLGHSPELSGSSVHTEEQERQHVQTKTHPQ